MGGGKPEEDVVQLVELYEAQVVRAAHALNRRKPYEHARRPSEWYNARESAVSTGPCTLNGLS